MHSARSNNLNLKYQRFTSLGCIEIGIRKFEFVSKTQFLSTIYYYQNFNPSPSYIFRK